MLRTGAVVILLSFLVVYGGVNFVAYRYSSSPRSVDVRVEEGEDFSQIADKLYDLGVVSHKELFRWEARVRGTDRRVHVGVYRIDEGMRASDILETFEEKRLLTFLLTIIEGTRLSDVRRLVEETPFLRGPIRKMPRAVLPETYRVSSFEKRQNFLDRAERDFYRVLGDIWKKRDKGLPLKTPHELLVLASVVEKETAREDERRLVAGVFVNRLNRKMRLQSDPTVLYGLKKTYGIERGVLTKADIALESPYNTYKIKGLPPEPIAMPGRSSLEAVAMPEDTDALYFVADGEGGHRFARTLKEHNRNVRLYRRNN